MSARKRKSGLSPLQRAIAASIKLERERRGWTTLDLALKSNVAFHYIEFIESGGYDLWLSQIERIAEAFGLPVDEVVRRASAEGKP